MRFREEPMLALELVFIVLQEVRLILTVFCHGDYQYLATDLK